MWRALRRLCIPLLVAVCAQLLTLAAASATPSITTYPLPPNGGWCTCPVIITVGPDGNLWFTENGGASGNGAIGAIATNGTLLHEYALSTYNSGPVGIAEGPSADGLWFTEQNTNRIGFITTAGAIREFSLSLSGSQPRGIALGSDGTLWFTQSLASTTTTTCTHHQCSTSTSTKTGYIGRITPSGAVTEFAIPNAYSRPFLITSGPDTNLWFTDEGTNSIGKITPTGTVTEFTLPTASSGPHGITTGPDGNLWVTEANANRVAQLNPTTGTVTEFAAPWGGPAGIAGPTTTNLWFTETGSSTNPAAIGEMTTSGAVLNNFPLSGNVDPQGITLGPDGRLWFTEEFGGTNGAIGTITTS